MTEVLPAVDGRRPISGLCPAIDGQVTIGTAASLADRARVTTASRRCIEAIDEGAQNDERVSRSADARRSLARLRNDLPSGMSPIATKAYNRWRPSVGRAP